MNYFPPEECPFYLITRSSLTLTSLLKKVLTDCGLDDVKPAYLGALMCLWKDENLDVMLSKFGSRDGMKLSELGLCAGLEPSTMTGLVDRMERDGLVYRSSDPNDRRAQQIKLTERGIKIQAAVFEAIERMFIQAFDGIASKDMTVVKKVLRNILANANKGGA
jgi:DNA-binding MarR family transcriptional regulator